MTHNASMLFGTTIPKKITSSYSHRDDVEVAQGRTRVGNGNTQIPKHQWNSGFLKNENNKKELFQFISTKISRTDVAGKLCLSTHLDVVLSNWPCDVTKLQPCNHSEADTRTVLHLAHAADHGHRKAFVRTVDSDIVVLEVGFFCKNRSGRAVGWLWQWKNLP